MQPFEIGDIIRLKPKDEAISIINQFWPEDTTDRQEYTEAILQIEGQILKVTNCDPLFFDNEPGGIRFVNHYSVTVSPEVCSGYWLLADLFDKVDEEQTINEHIPDLFGSLSYTGCVTNE